MRRLYLLLAHAVRIGGIGAAWVLFRVALHHALGEGSILRWMAVLAAGFALSESVVPEDQWYRRAFAILSLQGFSLNPDFAEALMHPNHSAWPSARARFRQIRDQWLLTEWHRVYVLSHIALYVGFVSLVAVPLRWGGHLLGWALFTYLSGWIGLAVHQRYLTQQVIAIVRVFAEDQRDAA
ncbi:MAG: hypothetical protein M1272_07815 [Firmicutes bacterium]|nr:hypothetical protein [Bacillota bacterium]